MSDVLSPNMHASEPEGRRNFLIATYKYLGIAIIAFAVLSGLFVMSGLSLKAAALLAGSGKYAWLAVLGAFMIVAWFATKIADTSESPQAQVMALAGYVVAESLIFMPLMGLAMLIAPEAIGAAALITLLLVAGLTYTAFTSKTDFSFLGGILKVGGFVALGTIVAAVVFGFKLGVWFSGLMILFAGGAVLYDTARIARDYPTDRPVGAALHLFASVALLFWYVLQLLLSLTNRD